MLELLWCLTCLVLQLLKESGPHWPPLWPLRWLWFSSGQEAGQQSSPLSLCPHQCCPSLACQGVCKVCCRYKHTKCMLVIMMHDTETTTADWYDVSYYLFISPMSWTPLSNRELADKPAFTIYKRTQKQLLKTYNKQTNKLLYAYTFTQKLIFA